ncbi:MAG: nitroreductase family deazaflavin-dependent oxidoreductase [Acidimicrobiia bacterium]|nr:nitroreductase family deazaflavin-dependent oxidoreductase [Acidimicrobiia bacterium]
MPNDATFKAVNALQRFVQRVSFGKLGWSGYGMPVVELTTTGRKSGQRRTVLLTSPWQDGDTFALVGSAGGNDQDPAWVGNIRADGAVTVRMRNGPPRPMRAHVAGAEERARLWPLITKDHANYADYQKKTERELPVVVIEPAD